MLGVGGVADFNGRRSFSGSERRTGRVLPGFASLGSAGQLKSIVAKRALERDAEAQAAFPNHAAALARRTVEHLEAVWQRGEFLELQTGAPRRVIDEDAFDHGRFRPNTYLRNARDSALGTLACVQSGILHDRELILGGHLKSILCSKARCGPVYPVDQF